MGIIKKAALLLVLSCLSFSCKFFNTVEETVNGRDYNSEITKVTFSSETLSVNVGESEYLKLTLSPSTNQGKCNVSWEWQEEFISLKTDNFGAVITGLKSGIAYIKASCNGIVATCLVSVISIGDAVSENPYIYSNYSVIQLMPGDSTTVSASLYGGSIADMEDFEWSINDSSIASISPARNNCVITANKTGSTQLIASHPNTDYSYSFVVYVYADKLTETYITTDYNVLTVNKNEVFSKILTVDLVNPISSTYKNGFTWNFADEKSKEIISMTANLNEAEIVPLKNGVANIVVSHENSQYDLNIIVRVSTIVKNIHVELSTSTLLVDGSDTPYTVYASLENYDGYVDSESFVWTVPENSESLADCIASGNSIRIQGKKNGTFKINVSHEKSEYSKSLLVILQNQIGSAIDSSMYITTDKNYIQTQVGKDPINVTVRLIGGIDGEDNIGGEDTNFSWYIKNGRNNEIVEIQQITGIVKDLSARSAVTSGNFCTGTLSINPIGPGEVTIVVTHPRCLYEMEIAVKVYPASIITNSKTISTDVSILKLLNGNSTTVSATVYNGNPGEENNIRWISSDSSNVRVSPGTGATVYVSANGTGIHQTYITAHLDGALSDKKILVLTADTEEELNSIKAIYTNSSYIKLEENEVKSVSVVPVNLTSSDRISWKTSNSSVCTVSGDSDTLYCGAAHIIGISAGKATITASVNGVSCEFEVTVVSTYSETIITNSKTISTDVSILKLLNGNSTTVSATVYNGNPGEENNIKWTSSDSSNVRVSPGTGATVYVSANGTGIHQTYITAHLDGALSDKKILVLTADTEEELNSIKAIYTDFSYVRIDKNQSTPIFVETVGFEVSDRISWKTSNSSVCTVEVDSSYENRARAFVTGVSAGSTTVIANLKNCEPCSFEINVVDVYSETIIVNPKTITTDESLIRILNGNTKDISATVRNQDSGDENKIQWSSNNTSKVSVFPTTGQTTVLSACGTGQGQTYVTAHLDGALSDKKILVLTADTEEELNSMKGIYADSTYLRISADEEKSISVETFGLSSTDRISWSSSNSSVCTVNGDSTSSYCSSASVKGISKGNATITARVGTSASVVFDITVLKKGESSDIFDENAGYLTTNLNAIVLESSVDDFESNPPSTTLNVTGVNISASDMALYTKWTMQDENAVEGDPVFELAGSPGSSVTLTANKKGKSKIKVSNKESMNSLSISAKCGELYEWTDEYVIYITTENDVINILNGESTTIGCSLVNTTSMGIFSWNVTQGSENIEITGLASGTCNITALQPGQSIITVYNTLAGKVTKEILVNVTNSEEELKGFKYLTTTQNVVTVGEKSNVTVNVEIKNADSDVISGYSWRSTNDTVASVSGAGNIAAIYGKTCGSAKIIVENYENCTYPLEIIVNVVDPVAAASDPYITCNNIVTCTVGGDNAVIAAELVGGSSGDETGFTWSIVDSSVAKIYASNDSAQIKAISEGVTQVVVSHPKASVSRSILVICEPKITTNCYITLTESIIKMSPSDDSKTITATLVNGDADDVYDFKWWADSYDKINMNYTGESCVIEPISAGTVTIHCSHPKAASTKDIILYISNYSDFAFASKYVELVTGTDTFVNMEVPATGVDCEVSYKSSNNSLCTVFGNSSVCTLHPGTVPDGLTSDSCTITATLQTKGGVKQAEAQILVSVTKKDKTKPYIGLYPDSSSTIITMNKDEVRNISAKLYGTTVDTTSSGLNWSINNGMGNFIEFTSSKTHGSNVQIRALASGKTTITVTHADENGVAINPMTIYVIVTGVSEPTVTLNYSKLPIYIGEDTQTLQATIKNDTGEELEWKVEDENQDYFTFTSKGNKASIYALKPGAATVYCTIPSNGSTASCEVEIREKETLEFFIYDDESNFTYENGTLIDNRTKYYINSLQLYPGETKPLHYETVPASDKITRIECSEKTYIDIKDVSYAKTWTDPLTKKVYHYPEGVGTIAITGKSKENENGTVTTLKATTASLQTSSISITNSYNYRFTVDKTIISSTPKEVRNNKEILYVNYELRPACSKIYVTNTTTGEVGKGFSLKNGNYDENQQCWIIDTHETTDETSSTGIVKGTLQFEVSGEVNCSINLKAVNENTVSSGTTTGKAHEFGYQSIKIQVYYTKHTFTPTIKRQVPCINQDVYSSTAKNAKYSRYDSATNTLFLGDGEYLTGTVAVNETSEPYSNVYISEVKFIPNSSSIRDGTSDNKLQSERVGGISTGSSYNSHDFTLYHSHDYAVYSYKETASSSSWKSVSKGVNNMYKLTIESDKTVEVRNETVKETSYVGYLQITYTNYAAGSGNSTFNIPVYVQVRNCPCADDGDYYKKYSE